MAISSKLTSRPRSCEFALLNFRFARHLHTMRSSQGIERIFAETPELISSLKGEQMYDGRPKARARKWRSRLLPAKSYAIA
jgi:hypothetical protein